YAELIQHDCRLWVDAGRWSIEKAELLRGMGVDTVIAGLESLKGPHELATFVSEQPADRIVFSLDLKDGRPLGASERWKAPDAWLIAEQAIRLGVRRLLVLDFAAVGRNQGTSTDFLCARLRAHFPEVEIATGGGIRSSDDLERLGRIGVDIALVA